MKGTGDGSRVCSSRAALTMSLQQSGIAISPPRSFILYPASRFSSLAKVGTQAGCLEGKE